VIAYHAGLPIPGGFIGVDIFFVVSGFVITGMLQRERLATGTIKLKAFYVRRFKRLMPALTLMVTFTVIVSALLLSTQGPQQITIQTGIGAMLFVGNMVVALTTANYFDASAEANPLMHTWSLSVEEQFYFIFPAILFAAWSLKKLRYSRHSAIIIVAFISTLSFGFASLGSRGYSYLLGEYAWLAGFYSPFTRIWEFGAGAFIALMGAKIARSSQQSTLLGFTGAIMVIASLFVITSATPLPGPWTLLPVVGTVLLLVAGTNTNPTSSLLATKPFVKVGDWSYSLYLWHWPLIVFAILIWPGSWIAPLTAAAISFLPAQISYYTVEQRFRLTTIRSNTRFAITTIGIPLGISALILMSLTVSWVPNPQQDLTEEVHPGEIGFTGIEVAHREHSFPCSDFDPPTFPGRPDEQITCAQSQPNSDIDIAVVGDSHAYVLYPGLINAFPNSNVAWIDAKGAPEMSNEKFHPILDYINSQPSITTVILNAFWTLRGVDQAKLTNTLNSLIINGKTPILTDDIPSFPFPPSRCKYKTALLLQPQCTIPRSDFEENLNAYLPTLEAASKAAPGTIFVRTSGLFCNESKCSMLRNNVINFADSNHVNLEGSNLLTSEIVLYVKTKELLTPE
jgi:peptidoglycan/LPS O-acetylase OafA/YrhL